MFYSADGKLIEYMDVDAMYKSIDEAKNNVIDANCSNLRINLGKEFENYNQAKLEKDQADLNIINIKKQLTAAENFKSSVINKINNSADKYNKILIDMNYQKCSI